MAERTVNVKFSSPSPPTFTAHSILGNAYNYEDKEGESENDIWLYKTAINIDYSCHYYGHLMPR